MVVPSVQKGKVRLWPVGVCSGPCELLAWLPHFRLDLELKDHEGSTALWLAVQYVTMSPDHSVNPFEDLPVVNGTSFDENSFAARLIQRGSNTNAPDTVTGDAGVPLRWGPGSTTSTFVPNGMVL